MFVLVRKAEQRIAEMAMIYRKITWHHADWHVDSETRFNIAEKFRPDVRKWFAEDDTCLWFSSPDPDETV